MVDRGWQRALVTGATGCIGSALVRRLVEQNIQVTALVRDPAKLQGALGSAAPRVRVVTGELNDPAALDRAVEGADVVFHAAARVHTVPRSAEEEKEFWRVNVGGTEALLSACAPLSTLKALVFCSTVAVYGPTGGALTEATPCHPETVYGQTKLEAEQRVLAFQSASGARGVVLRLSMVYGEGDRGNLQRMIRAIERGRFVHIGGGRTPKSATYVENVVDAALLVAAAPAARGEVFLVSDPEPYTLRQIGKAIARELGVAPPRLSLPLWPMKLAGHSFGLLQKLTGVRVPFTAREVRTLTTPLICDTTKLQKLGFHARFGLEEGIARTVRAHRSQSGTKAASA